MGASAAAILLVMLAASIVSRRRWRRQKKAADAERERQKKAAEAERERQKKAADAERERQKKAAEAVRERQEKVIQRCEAEAKAHKCSFWWVSARALRNSKDVTLHKFQELRQRDGFLEKKTVSRHDSVHGTLTTKFLTVSHRWLGGVGMPPDPTGTQLSAIRKYLAEHLEVEWVWFECVSPIAPHSPWCAT